MISVPFAFALKKNCSKTRGVDGMGNGKADGIGIGPRRVVRAVDCVVGGKSRGFGCGGGVLLFPSHVSRLDSFGRAREVGAAWSAERAERAGRAAGVIRRRKGHHKGARAEVTRPTGHVRSRA